MKRISIILLSLIFLASCSIQSNSIQPYTSIEDSINLLTNKSFDGRRPGTKGNIKTQEYLKKSLENLNIQPYSETYYWAFPYTLYFVKDAYIEADSEKFNYNKDFQIRYATDSPISITSVLKSEPISGEKCVLLTEDIGRNINNDEDVQAIILNVNSFDNLELIYEPNIKNKPLIIVEEATYIKLHKKLNSDISIHINLEKQQKNENNIVGIIKADNNPENQAVVISAHFDHIGSYNDKLYAGALDNASGVSAVLEITKNLVENLKQEEINKDIIIAFFNLEEEILRLGGSNKLAGELENKYSTVLDINIDCIGLNYGKTVVGYNNSTSVNDSTVKELEEILTKSSIDTITGEYSTSDHMNFRNGICLYSEKQGDVIHSEKDTVENLDLEKIQKISNLLGSYIIDLCKRDDLSSDDTKESMITYHGTTPANEMLDIGTCKVIEKDGKRHHLSGHGFYGKLEEAEGLFNYAFSKKFENILEVEKDSFIYLYIANFLNVLEKQDNGKYMDKDIKCNISGLYMEEHELNKLYEKKITLDDVVRINIEGVFVEKFNNNIQFLVSDQYERDIKSIIDNTEIILNYKDYEIYYYYNQMQEGKYLSIIKEIGENKYICYAECKESDIFSEEDVKKLIEENNIITLWEAILDIFEE